MKIKLDTEDNLPTNKQLKFPIMTIVVRSVFEKDGKFYPQIYLDKCLHDYKNATVRKKLMFRKELALIN